MSSQIKAILAVKQCQPTPRQWHTRHDADFTNEGSKSSGPALEKKMANIMSAFVHVFGKSLTRARKEKFSVALSHKIHSIICDGDFITGGGQLWDRQRHGPQVSDGCRHDGSLSEAEVRQQLDELFSFCNDLIASESKEAGMTQRQKFEAGAFFIYRYLAIHPYCDGNGRVARLLTSLLLMRLRAVAGPVCFNLRPENRQSYVAGLNVAGVTGPESLEALRPLADLLQQAAKDTEAELPKMKKSLFRLPKKLKKTVSNGAATATGFFRLFA